MINWQEGLRTLSYGYAQHEKSHSERKTQFRNIMRSWEDPAISNCLKIFPLMLTEHSTPWRKPTFIFDLLSNTDHCYFLMRKDFQAQVKSAAAAFYKTMLGEMNFHGSWDKPFFIPDNVETRQLIRTCERQMYAQNYQLITMWHTVAPELANNYTREILWLEDIDQTGKYNRPIEWEKTPEIPDYDWEIYFT